MSQTRHQLINWLILLILAFTWGSSFILMKRGLVSFTPTQVASLRIFCAFLFLLPLSLPNLKKASNGRWFPIFLVGFLGNLVPAFLFTRAQTGLSSSLTGMLNSLTPLFTLILGIWFFRTQVSKLNITGVLIGLVGAAGLILMDSGSTVYGNFSFAFYVVIATILYAFSVNVIKKYLQDVNSVHIASLALFFVGLPCGIFLFTTDFTERLTNDPQAMKALLFVLILGIIGTALAVILFNVLIKRTSALFASSVTYMIPVFALMWGIIDGETIHPAQILFVLVILGGIYLVNRKKGNTIK